MAKIHAMTDMKLDDEDIIDMATPIAIAVKDRAMYPYGLRISLTDKELKKLDIDAGDAFVGGIIHLHALARVTSVSSNQMEGGGDCCRIELQIEDLAVESEDDENDDY